MQTSPKELSDLFHYSEYQKLLKDSRWLLKLSLNEQFPEVLYQYDLKKLCCSALTLADLHETLANSQSILLPFVKLKFSENSEDLNGEFPENELPGEEDHASIVKKMPVYRNFLLAYLIEFTILKTQPDTVNQYLKCVRILNATTYAKRLKAWYAQAQNR